MCNEKDCKHDKTQPVNISARDMRLGKALFATLAMRYYSVHETPGEMGNEVFHAGACMMACDEPTCVHNQEYMHALVLAIDHVDNGAPLDAQEKYEALIGPKRTVTIESLIGQLFQADSRGIVDTVIVDDKASVVFDATGELDTEDPTVWTALSLAPQGVVH
jgi:hypothetical protein